MALSPQNKKPHSVSDVDGKQAVGEQAALTLRRSPRFKAAARSDFSEFDNDPLWQEIFGGPLPPLTDSEDEDEEMPLATPTKGKATGRKVQQGKGKRSPKSQAAPTRPATLPNNAAGRLVSVLKTPKKNHRSPQRPSSGTTPSRPGDANRHVCFGPSVAGPSSEARLPPVIEYQVLDLDAEKERIIRERELEALLRNRNNINKRVTKVQGVIEEREESMERMLGPPAQSPPVRFGSTDTEMCEN